MPNPDELRVVLEPLRALQNALDHFNNKGVIIGGIAVSLLGKPRLTADLDAMLIASVEQISEILEVFRAEGMLPRLKEPIPFARRNRILLLRHTTGTNIDISLGCLPFELEVIERSIVVEVEGISLRLPSVEDLIIMKAVANREKDLQDIRSLVEIHPAIDRQRIVDWVQQFADVMESSKILDDLKKNL